MFGLASTSLADPTSRPAPGATLGASPVSAPELERMTNRNRERDRPRPCRLGCRRAPRGARRRAARGRTQTSSSCASRTAPSPPPSSVRHSSCPNGSGTRAARRRSRRSTRTSAGSGCTRSRRSTGPGTRASSTAPTPPSPARRDEARAGRARSSPTLLGLSPFDLDDADRALYHAGAAIASNYLVTLHRAARASCSRRPARRPQALEPLMRRMIENGFELTGPIARGDWETVERHLDAIRERDARTSSPSTARWRRRRATRDGTAAHDRRAPRGARARSRPDANGRPRPDDGRVPRGSPVALFRAAREENDVVVVEPLRQPGAVRRPARPRAHIRATRSATSSSPSDAGVDVLFAPERERALPGRVPDLGRGRGARLDRSRASSGPGHFRGVATVCLKLFNIVRPDRAYFGQKDAQQAAVVRRLVRDLNVPVEIRVVPTVRDEDGLALSSRNARLSADGARARRSRSPAPSRRDDPAAGARAARRRSSRLRRGRRLRAEASSPPPSASATPA